ncbi:MAG: InlB B-repeat-containing protein, partial [Paludibacteraceae bacterium]|nr:InlB B-repeat-containing protein [Paludibacteraceae bacterium]
MNISLFAQWTEHPYTVTTSVSPAGAGTLSCGSSVTAKWVTPTELITATASIGYSFKEWDFSKTGEDNDVYSAEGYTSLSNPICINARHDGTLTAKFTANNYNVNLENLGADEGYKGTENVSVTYNSSVNLTENITIPEKAHYDFGGYYTSSDEGVTLDVPLIDATGAWIASVDEYTDGDKNWLYTDNLTLYAKWTEHPYTIALVVDPEGAGTIKIGEDIVGSVNAFISTKTNLITATPANPAWKFKEWKYSENVDPANGTGNDNTVQINATQDGTLTAVFEPRYALVGQLNDGSNEAGGMPGMDVYTVDFDFVSYTGLGEEGVELRCTRSLQPNKQYKFAIHDHVIGRNYGKNSGSDNPTLDAGESWELNTIDHDVLFNTSAAGEYTFKITRMTYGENGDYKCYYPTVEIVYPTAHQLELGWRYTLIDTPDELKVGDTGGTVTATSSGFSIKDQEYIADGKELQLKADANIGYSFDNKWYDYENCQNSFMSGNPTHATVTSHFRVYAKFAEIPTPITITKIGGGEVQINGEDKESTSVGVTTTRTLRAVAAAGYIFSGWTLPDNADFEMIEGDVDNPTITLRGKGAGDAGEIVATFTECCVLSAESDGWGSAEFTIANIEVEDGKAIGYADIALPANTNLQFKVVDKSTSSEYKNGVDQVYYMTYGNSQDWSFGTDKTYNCGITTAGRGSYRFEWNFTDKTMTVVYPESYQVNYGAAVGGSVTSVLDDDHNVVPNGVYVRKGGSVTYEATANNGYIFTGWCSDAPSCKDITVVRC